MRYPIVGFALFLAAFGQIPALKAQDAGLEFFEKKIRPVLVEHCYECHSVGAKKIRGQLLLDSRDGVRKGGVSGPVIEPGDPDKSLLIKAVRYTDDSTKMPKKGKLPAALIADLEAWVKMGAPDPRNQAAAVKNAKSWDEIVRDRRAWWSLQPVKTPALPTPRNTDWSKHPIDRFLLAAMEAKGLTPAQDADPRTLIRRLSLVLTGLAPSAPDVEDFAKAWHTSAKPQAVIEQLVNIGFSNRAALRRTLDGTPLDGQHVCPLHRRRTAMNGTTKSIMPGSTSRLPDPRFQRRFALRSIH